LRRIDRSVDSHRQALFFGSDPVKSIHIPRSVLTIGKACFEFTTIESLTFEPGSQLRLFDE
jgi:hypothetical protein